MARYQGHVAIFRATVPLGVQDPRLHVRAEDRRRPVHAQEVAGARPRARRSCAATSSSSAGLSLDITGTLPTPDAGAGLPRRQGRRTSATSWSTRCWRRRSTATTSPTSGPTSCASSAARPAGPGLRHLRLPRLDPRGDRRPTSRTTSSSARSWRPSATRSTTRRRSGTRSCTTPEQFVDDTAQVFLGLRLACAQCHHHPYEKWSQDDYWGLAAFFGRVGRKNVPIPGEQSRTSRRSEQVIYTKATGNVINKRTGQAAVMKPLDGEPIDGRPRRGPAAEAGGLDGRRQEPVLRPGRGQPLLGPLLRPRHRRSAGRHARHQPAAAIPSCSTPWPRTWSSTSTA